MHQQPETIRTDMHRDRREAFQNQSVQYLDKILMKAFTAHDREAANYARGTLTDIQGQCLRHIHFLSEIEGFYRSRAEPLAFDSDEDAYTELVSFISGLGACLSGVSHQLGFSAPENID